MGHLQLVWSLSQTLDIAFPPRRSPKHDVVGLAKVVERNEYLSTGVDRDDVAKRILDLHWGQNGDAE